MMSFAQETTEGAAERPYDRLSKISCADNRQARAREIHGTCGLTVDTSNLTTSANLRFAIGVAVFLGTALAYPWYAGRVDDHLAAQRSAAAEALQTQSQADQRLAAPADYEDVNRSAALREQTRRQASVQVKGTSGSSPPMALVDLGEATLAEARGTICRQAEMSLGASLAGSALRVQRYRDSQPALDIGQVRC